MVPEVKTIDPQYLAVQQARFDGAAQDFGQTYSRGQNFLSTGTDIVRRLTGRPTLQQEIAQSIANVTERRLDLVEATARMAVQGIVDEATYLRELANHSAHAYMATGEAILAATQAENNNLGFADKLYRVNLSIFGSAMRFVYGGFAYLAASSANYDPQTAAVIAEAGIFLAATGGLDTVRFGLLDVFKRNDRGADVATTPNLIRRKASIQEGQITGDMIGDSQAINQVLEQRLAQQILAEFQIRGVRRPDFLNPDLADILAQREALRAPVGGYDHLTELTKSRDIARVSRLTRTLLYTALAVGLLHIQMARPQYCGTSVYANPDNKVGAFAGGMTNLSSLKGKAEADWFKRLTGKDFDDADPKDKELFDTVYNTDPEGNAEIVRRIAEEIKRKNPGMEFATPDLFLHNPGNNTYWLVCNGEVHRVYFPPIKQ